MVTVAPALAADAEMFTSVIDLVTCASYSKTADENAGVKSTPSTARADKDASEDKRLTTGTEVPVPAAAMT